MDGGLTQLATVNSKLQKSGNWQKRKVLHYSRTEPFDFAPDILTYRDFTLTVIAKFQFFKSNSFFVFQQNQLKKTNRSQTGLTPTSYFKRRSSFHFTRHVRELNANTKGGREQGLAWTARREQNVVGSSKRVGPHSTIKFS